MKKVFQFLKGSRKAIGAGVGTFLASFPLVDAIEGDQVGEVDVMLKQALAASAVAVVTYFLRNEAPADV